MASYTEELERLLREARVRAAPDSTWAQVPVIEIDAILARADKDERIYTKADAEALCEVAVAAARKAQFIPDARIAARVKYAADPCSIEGMIASERARADDIPTIIRRSTWRTPELRESAARLVANILRDDDDPHPPVPPDHFPVA